MTQTLENLQSAFQEFLLGSDDAVLSRVSSTKTMPAQRRLAIYQFAYYARLIDALADTYERVLYFVGSDFFETVARAYVEQHPSTTRNLRDYGLAFPQFLSNQYPDEPIIAELAKMDKCLRYTFDAADAVSLVTADLAAIQADDWDNVVFQLHPSVSWLNFEWNTVAIWQSLRDEKPPPSPIRLENPTTWLFWRKELQPHFRSMSEHELIALVGISNRQSFGETCISLAAGFPDRDFTTAIASWLRAWLEDGILQNNWTIRR